jgi:hypothetical protein
MLDFGEKETPELIKQINAQGYPLTWDGEEWIYAPAHETPIQVFIDRYEPISYWRRRRLRESQEEAGRRLARVMPYLYDIAKLHLAHGYTKADAYRLVSALVEMLADIYPALNSADIPANLLCARQIYQFKNGTAKNYINSPSRTLQQLKDLNIPQHPAWPDCSD